MSNRIQPTHFVKSFNSILFDHSVNSIPFEIRLLNASLTLSAFLDTKVVALFLIREKTPQEQANSIYYPLNKQK